MRRAALLLMWIALASCSSSANASPPPSPTPDQVTREYIALEQSYWIQLQAADERSNGVNVAAQACLNEIDPPVCGERAKAILIVQEAFLSDLQTTRVPSQFAAEDRAIRAQLPKVILDVKALIAAAATGNKQAVLDAAKKYVDDMIPTITDALDRIDPTVVHD